MKYSFLLLIVFITSCNTKKNNTVAVTKTDTVYIKEYCDPLKGKEKIDVSFRTKLDTVRIEYEYDTLVYTKDKFNEIVENVPELHEEYPRWPDFAYVLSGEIKLFVDAAGNKKDVDFRSEIGHDTFNMLYAYLLRSRSKFSSADELRNKLINSFHIIRDLNLSIVGFGTYYTHQYRRIYGYAEYWVYQLGKDYHPDSSPSFVEQRKDFMNTLKKEIKYRLETDNEYLPRERAAKFVELLPYINKLESEISNMYILRCVQEYRYSYYQ